MQDVINVIVVKNVAIEENVAVRNPNDAERIFLEFCAKYLSNFDEYTQEDIDVMLEEGYEGFRDGFIAISWAEVTLKNW